MDGKAPSRDGQRVDVIIGKRPSSELIGEAVEKAYVKADVVTHKHRGAYKFQRGKKTSQAGGASLSFLFVIPVSMEMNRLTGLSGFIRVSYASTARPFR